MPPWDGFNNSIIANRQKDTFVHGFLDVSGRAFIRNGNLVVGYDSSLNGNVSIGNDLIIGGRLSVRQYDTRNIINTTTTNYQLIVSEDLSLNGRLFTSGNVEIGGNVRMAPSFTSSTNVTPNTTSATSYTWTKDNIGWNASSSSEFSTAYSYKLFDSTLTTAWGSTNASPNNYVNGSYNSSGTTTTSNINSIFGITSLKGEWVQIRSSIPLILNSYQFTSGSTMIQMPKTYYILGSNDGSIWYGIQYGTMSAAPVSTIFTTISNVINASTTYSSSSYGSSTISTTTYGNNNNAYMYYRIIFTNMFTTSTISVDIGEWTPTFTLQTDTLTLSSNKSTSNNMVLSVDGRVGVGVTTPVTFLDVRKDNAAGSSLTGAVFRGGADDAFSKTMMNAVGVDCALPASLYTNLFYIYGRYNNTNYRYSIQMSGYFTGQHANYPIDQNLKTNIVDYVGLLVSSADQGYYSRNCITNEILTGKKAITITECLPKIILTSTDKDPAVWGIITNVKNDDINTDGTIPTDDKPEFGDRLSSDMIRINGVGEGGIWVTNINGNIINGDFICSSIIPGYGRKQDDDLFHNYTAAKATMSCNFDINNNDLYQCKEIEFNGNVYLAAFIGVVYHCS
jgi:hypothetical protein